MKNCTFYSWGQSEYLVRKLVDQIKKSNFKPNFIIGISRCGMVPAVHIAYLLEMDNLLTIKARTTPNDTILPEKNIEPCIELLFSNKKISGANLLLVDSAIASGTTMSLCLEKLSLLKIKEVRTAVLVDWPESPYKLKEKKRPVMDYVGKIIDKWPNFPWER